MQLWTLGPGYQILNLSRPSDPPLNLEVLEAIPYQGQQITYGQTMVSEIWTPQTLGHQRVNSRPVCFPVFSETVDMKSLSSFIEGLKGPPLVCRLPSGAQYPIVNLPDPYIIWPGPRFKRGAMIARSCKVVDLFLFWQEHQQVLPIEFVNRRNYVQGLSWEQKESIMNAFGESLIRRL